MQMKLDHVAPRTKFNPKVNPKWVKDLSIKLEAIKRLQENMGEMAQYQHRQ